jgi:hypothetical protein
MFDLILCVGMVLLGATIFLSCTSFCIVRCCTCGHWFLSLGQSAFCSTQCWAEGLDYAQEQEELKAYDWFGEDEGPVCGECTGCGDWEGGGRCLHGHAPLNE